MGHSIIRNSMSLNRVAYIHCVEYSRPSLVESRGAFGTEWLESAKEGSWQEGVGHIQIVVLSPE